MSLETSVELSFEGSQGKHAPKAIPISGTSVSPTTGLLGTGIEIGPRRSGLGGSFPAYGVIPLECQGRVSIEFDIKELVLAESGVANSQMVNLKTPKMS